MSAELLRRAAAAAALIRERREEREVSDYEPGTVAVATVRGDPGVRVFRVRNAWVHLSAGNEERHYPSTYEAIYDTANEVTDVRPLVVLDLSQWKPMHIAALPVWLRDRCFDAPSEACVRAIADQIEAQTRPHPPTPPEPRNLWAVVEGREDNRWVRDESDRHRPWRHLGPTDRTSQWRYIVEAYGPVAVLSEGVSS